MRRRVLAGAMAAVALECVLAASSGAAVQVGASGWQWGNPLPQGNTVNAVSFAGATGYAVGAFGTILSTSDGGSTWAGVKSGTFAELTEVQAIDAQSVFAGGGCVGRRSDDGGVTVVRVAFTPVEASCSQPLAAAWWVNRVTGYIVLADGTTLRTDNNGDTFAQKVAVPGTAAAGGRAKVNDIRFLDAATGLAATDNGKLYRTTDAANSWTEVSSTATAVKKLLFLDASHGVAVGVGSVFLVTTDGGLTWAEKPLGAASGPQNLVDVSCADLTTCVMATATSQLARTTDGGMNATLVTPSQTPLLAAGFASATRVAALGSFGTTAVSDDAGAGFAPVGGNLPGTYSGMVAGPPGVAFAPGQKGALAKTTDSGATWVRGNVSTPNDVIDVAFPTASNGFALDNRGGLFRTADGGATWRALDIGTTAQPAAVEAPSTQIAVIAGPRGLRRSADAGETFTAVSGPVSKSQLSGIDTAGPALFAYGGQDVWRSRDKGKTWTAVRKPGKYVSKHGKRVNTKGVKRVDFVNAGTGYLLDTKGFTYRTSNGGKSWTALLATGNSGAYGMAFNSASSGYLIISDFGPGRGGFLLRTTDSGKTWTPEFVVASQINGAGLAAGGGGTDYLLGGASNLLYTKSGGLTGATSTLSIATKTKRFKKRPKTSITVTGRLDPTQGADQVTVSYLKPGGTAWSSQTVKVAGNGAYTTSWRLAKGANTFVAQWPGNFKNAGRGTKPLTVKVGK
jgi:photosystem II stability/assembly factor-like uncharacterized protein